MTENENTTTAPETGDGDPLLELERLNTLLRTTENALTALQAEKQKGEAEILDLRQKLVQANKAKEGAEADRDERIANLEAQREKADAERRRAVEKRLEQQQELDTLRRANKSLQRQYDSMKAVHDDYVDNEYAEEPDPAYSKSSRPRRNTRPTTRLWRRAMKVEFWLTLVPKYGRDNITKIVADRITQSRPPAFA